MKLILVTVFFALLALWIAPSQAQLVWASGAPATNPIIPANRITTWQPGVTYNGGITNRTTIFTTLTPNGTDDTSQIQTALNNCPSGQVVKLSTGVFKVTGNGVNFISSNCTLRGSGPGANLNTGQNAVGVRGTFVTDASATQIIKSDRLTNTNNAILYIGNDAGQFTGSTNLTADAVLNTNSVTVASATGLSVGQIVLIDMCTDVSATTSCTYSGTDVVWGPQHDPPGTGSRGWFVRTDRSMSQVMEISGINGTTITFTTPFHYTYTTAAVAQLSRYAQTVTHGIGIEDIFFFGGEGGDYHGNVSMNLCAYCWIKHVEAYWAEGTNIGLYGCFRSEVRDSYIHETPNPNPGGAGYLIGMAQGSADNLFENNIMWYGNKEIVMRGTGGGNVIAYNYMDDAFGEGFPDLVEAGVNAGHYTTPHMELIEGNYSQNYSGDSFWGNSIYITVYRNWLSAIRAAHPPLNTYSFNSGGCILPYGDFNGPRTGANIQAYSYYTNMIGNVMGSSGQVLLSGPSCNGDVQVGFVFEKVAAGNTTNTVDMWYIGECQACIPQSWVATTYQTQLRDGNWDFVTNTQTWLGIGGTQGSPLGTPKPIPNSMYLSSKPAFFTTNTWPWVDPSTGTTYTLPAKLRFDNNTPNTVP